MFCLVLVDSLQYWVCQYLLIVDSMLSPEKGNVRNGSNSRSVITYVLEYLGNVLSNFSMCFRYLYIQPFRSHLISKKPSLGKVQAGLSSSFNYTYYLVICYVDLFAC